MKKVICSFGTIALIACSVSDVSASRAFEKIFTYGGMVDAPKQITKRYDAATKKNIVTNHNRGLTYTEKSDEELKEKRDEARGLATNLSEKNDRLEKQVVALQKTQQAQQELLEGYGKELKRIATFCDQVQAFIK